MIIEEFSGFTYDVVYRIIANVKCQRLIGIPIKPFIGCQFSRDYTDFIVVLIYKYGGRMEVKLSL